MRKNLCKKKKKISLYNFQQNLFFMLTYAPEEF